MKKPLILFIIFTVLLFIAQFAYTKYCKSRPGGCRQEKKSDSDTGPKKGIDW